MSRLVAISAIALGITFAAVGGTRCARARAQGSDDDELLLLPRSSALRAMSLGHHELAADLVYMRAVIYFGSEVSGKRGFQWLGNYLQTVVDLDPAWKTPYRWAGVATMYNGQTITRASVETSSRFLREGIARFPSDWELPFMLACNLSFEMKPKDAAEKARLTAEGAEWFRRASLVGGAPPWAALLTATIYRKEGREDAALHHLEQVYYTSTDERTRTEVRNRLIALKTKVDFERETKERARFEAAWHAELPYVPSHLYVLVGSTAPANLDWRANAVERGLLPATDARLPR